MAAPINTPLTGDIWHLCIDDLLAPLPEKTRLGGSGPFVINLSASTAPIGLPPVKSIAECQSAYVYQVQRTEDRRLRYRLRLGPFPTEDEADAILDKVRDLYPSALTATADADDLRAIATVRAKEDTPQSSAEKSRQKPSKKLTLPKARVDLAPAISLAATSTAPPAAAAAPAAAMRPIVAAPPAVVPPPAAAAAPAAAMRPIVAAPPAVVPPPAAAAAPAAAMRPTVVAPPAVVPPPAATAAPIAAARPTVAAPTVVPPPTAIPTLTAAAPSPMAAAPSPMAAAPSPPPVAVPLSPPVLTVEHVIRKRAPAVLPQKPMPSTAAPPPAAAHHVEQLSMQELGLETTQTIRALTAVELEDDEVLRWFVIQLSLSEEAFDSDTVPNLDIFSVYRLYCVAGIDQGRILHALRLGFFTEEVAAAAVASYLAEFYDKPIVKRVSAAERNRFVDQRFEPRKDVGATGKHAVIEITNERYIRERRATAVSVPHLPVSQRSR
jgi:SPOR domain